MRNEWYCPCGWTGTIIDSSRLCPRCSHATKGRLIRGSKEEKLGEAQILGTLMLHDMEYPEKWLTARRALGVVQFEDPSSACSDDLVRLVKRGTVLCDVPYDQMGHEDRVKLAVPQV